MTNKISYFYADKQFVGSKDML